MARKRRVFEEGHGRKLLVVVDESPEVELALFYAAGRVLHAGGVVLLLYVSDVMQLASALVDARGWLRLPRRPVTAVRGTGLLLLVAGSLLVQLT